MVNFDDFKTFYNKFPDKPNSFYYKQFPRGNKSTIRSYKFRLRKIIKANATVDATKKKQRKKEISINPPKTTKTPFIDDPDELLMSVSTRELNRPNPDPRWASILISVRKENIGKSKKEGDIQSKFKSMDIKELVKISAWTWTCI